MGDFTWWRCLRETIKKKNGVSKISTPPEARGFRGLSLRGFVWSLYLCLSFRPLFHQGKYDFFYLPIDFQTDNNLGCTMGCQKLWLVKKSAQVHWVVSVLLICWRRATHPLLSCQGICNMLCEWILCVNRYAFINLATPMYAEHFRSTYQVRKISMTTIINFLVCIQQRDGGKIK